MQTEEEDDTHLIQILRHLGSAEGEAFDECIINEANLMTDAERPPPARSAHAASGRKQRRN